MRFRFLCSREHEVEKATQLNFRINGFDISNKFAVNDNTFKRNNLKKDYYIENGMILPKKNHTNRNTKLRR